MKKIKDILLTIFVLPMYICVKIFIGLTRKER